ncbi:AbrB family transcriptional regulator [Nocardioides sp. cx-173]|uniref:AbrB family transcriptional regulator n=1 Tax=Nocardioides sp. cx-173 TaxID=2898796 RepID=UPI001E6006EF|nr:AbrB family transcriptional regulator [Nocardioides sp. cx-173]MCD4526020.1 AbrB family transcriptional regulator [Nocardioides sp. cx-173]UGB43715.1 AbrB family transcriptional regulator [Nocardioides sp. cx-173]
MNAAARTPLAGAALVLVATIVLTLTFSLMRVPSAVLFGSLLGGMTHALTSPTEIRVPPIAFRLGQGVIGATIGTLVSVEALRRIAGELGPVLLVTLGTIGISLFAGWLLALRRDVSLVTGTFALVAGGASGVVAISRELGADERVVTVVQYLRVLVVLVTLPLVIAVVFHPETGQGVLSTADGPLAIDLVYVVAAVGGGLLLARLVRVSTATLLAPLAIAAVIASSGWLGDVAVPDPVQWAGYALIGVEVGLRFTRASLASIARMLPVVTLLIVAMLVLTALLGAALTRFTSVDALTAYLATTPGGLFAVLAIAADSGSDVTYVMAAQLFRLVMILLLMPLLAPWLSGRRPPSSGAAPS